MRSIALVLVPGRWEGPAMALLPPAWDENSAPLPVAKDENGLLSSVMSEQSPLDVLLG